MNFEQLLSAVGGFGRYQKTLYVWICLPQILLAFHMMVSVFTGATPPHRCRVPSWNLTHLEPPLANFSGPRASGHVDQCEVKPTTNHSVRPACEGGWVYSRDVFETTTVTEVTSAQTSGKRPLHTTVHRSAPQLVAVRPRVKPLNSLQACWSYVILQLTHPSVIKSHAAAKVKEHRLSVCFVFLMLLTLTDDDEKVCLIV